MKMEDPIVIFGKWAEEGKDLGMEKGHANSVKEMLEFACKERADLKQKFSFLDVGCGSGYVCSLMAVGFLMNMRSKRHDVKFESFGAVYHTSLLQQAMTVFVIISILWCRHYSKRFNYSKRTIKN